MFESWHAALFDDAAVSSLWSIDAQLRHYRAFEVALAEALEACGRVSAGQGNGAAEAIMRADVDHASLVASTERDGLPIPDLVRQLRAEAGSDAAAVHVGATSQDVLDTALALTLREITDLLIERLRALNSDLIQLTARVGDTQVMGRTRMQAALPIPATHRIQSWQQPLAAHVDTLDRLRGRTERLQLGGAVGTREDFGEDSPRIAEHMAKVLGIANEPAWHTDRTAIAEYGSRLSLITGSLGKFGQDVALMAQQGIDEIQLDGGGGSSAMPHKSNPILAELLVTLARFNATQVAGLQQAVIHEQERSGAAWMLEWMILPQMTVTTARALRAAQDLCASIAAIGSKS